MHARSIGLMHLIPQVLCKGSRVGLSPWVGMASPDPAVRCGLGRHHLSGVRPLDLMLPARLAGLRWRRSSPDGLVRLSVSG